MSLFQGADTEKSKTLRMVSAISNRGFTSVFGDSLLRAAEKLHDLKEPPRSGQLHNIVSSRYFENATAAIIMITRDKLVASLLRDIDRLIGKYFVILQIHCSNLQTDGLFPTRPMIRGESKGAGYADVSADQHREFRLSSTGGSATTAADAAPQSFRACRAPDLGFAEI